MPLKVTLPPAPRVGGMVGRTAVRARSRGRGGGADWASKLTPGQLLEFLKDTPAGIRARAGDIARERGLVAGLGEEQPYEDSDIETVLQGLLSSFQPPQRDFVDTLMRAALVHAKPQGQLERTGQAPLMKRAAAARKQGQAFPTWPGPAVPAYTEQAMKRGQPGVSPQPGPGIGGARMAEARGARYPQPPYQPGPPPPMAAPPRAGLLQRAGKAILGSLGGFANQAGFPGGMFRRQY